MSVMKGRSRVIVAAASSIALLAVAACGGDDDGTPTEPEAAADNGDEPDEEMEEITLSVHVFGGNGFGFEGLVEEYMAESPGIIVDHQVTTDDYDGEYRPNLIQQLDAGTAPDIAAVEESAVGQFMAMNDAWVDLAQYGLDSREADYPAWVWANGHTNDGKLATIGSDVGGMAMCYRTDLFEQAGLPTDPEEVAASWTTWDDFVGVAEEFAGSGVDAAFVDSPDQLLNIRMIQEGGAGDGITYFDRDNNYVAGESPAVQTAFDFVMELHSIGAVGPFDNFTDEWNAATAAGGFATMACPAWMLGVVQGNAGEENAGNWNVAPLPGGGGGNWGGAWLGVTANSEHPEEAAALVDFLTSPEAQLAAWDAVSRFPASPEAQSDPSVADTRNEYFNDAPSGQIIIDSLAAYEPVFFGALHSAVKQPMEAILLGVVQGSVSPDEAWDAFIAAGQEVVDLEN